MCTHMMSHQGNCCCNRKLKNVTLTENWKEVKCKLCQRTEQYFMAKQDSPKEPLSACGKTFDEFMARIDEDCSNVEFKFHDGWAESLYRNNVEFAHVVSGDIIKRYRIKEPTPSIAKQKADGWNKKAINQASFELKYTITETKLAELIEIAEHGDTCKVEYSSPKQMTEDALALTSECVEALLKGLIGIRGE